MEQIVRTILYLIPKDVSGWALLLLVLVVSGVLVFNAIDVSRKKVQRKKITTKKDEDWLEANLSIRPNRRTETHMPNLDYMETITTAELLVTNNEKFEITDCYATLEQASFYQPPYFRPLPVYSDRRLQWTSDIPLGKDCKDIIPPQNKIPKRVSVWSSRNLSHFNFCDPSNKKNDLYGVYVITIRIDGKRKGEDIKPIYFNGYLYTEKVTTTHTNPNDGSYSEIPIGLQHPYDIVIFKEGNWENDPDIPTPRPAKDSDEKTRKDTKKRSSKRATKK